MPLPKAAGEEETSTGQCRRCRTFCDKLIEPRGCVELGCRYLYSYADPLSGNAYMGCLRKVFRAEIDVEMFREAERGGGYGGVKMSGQALPQCQFRVEPAFEGDGPSFACVNPRFFDCADSGPEGIRAFDIRQLIED